MMTAPQRLISFLHNDKTRFDDEKFVQICSTFEDWRFGYID